MSPQTLSILNNAKIFLSDQELRELAVAINKELGDVQQPVAKVKKLDALTKANYTIESVTEHLLANQFRPRKRKQV